MPTLLFDKLWIYRNAMENISDMGCDHVDSFCDPDHRKFKQSPLYEVILPSPRRRVHTLLLRDFPSEFDNRLLRFRIRIPLTPITFRNNFEARARHHFIDDFYRLAAPSVAAEGGRLLAFEL